MQRERESIKTGNQSGSLLKEEYHSQKKNTEDSSSHAPRALPSMEEMQQASEFFSRKQKSK
jgi:hypothetical protein